MKSIYKKTIRDSQQSQNNRRRVSNFSRRDEGVKNANHRDLFLDLLHLLIGFRKLISAGTFLPALTSPLFRPKKEDKQWDIRSSFVFWLLFRMFLFRHEKMRVLPLFYCCSDYFLKDFLSVFYRAQHLISLFFFFHLKFCRRDVDWPLNFCD